MVGRDIVVIRERRMYPGTWKSSNGVQWLLGLKNILPISLNAGACVGEGTISKEGVREMDAKGFSIPQQFTLLRAS